MIHLITGGARSGKSRFAEQCVADMAKADPSASVYYLATATAEDEEMHERIRRHKCSRPPAWQTIEVPRLVSETAQTLTAGLVLMDCMTLWLSNWLCDGETEGWHAEKQRFLQLLTETQHLKKTQQDWVIVTNEVGSGIVPMGALTRRFADEAGRLNQSVAAIADQVTLVVAGCTLPLKPPTETGV